MRRFSIEDVSNNCNIYSSTQVVYCRPNFSWQFLQIKILIMSIFVIRRTVLRIWYTPDRNCLHGVICRHQVMRRYYFSEHIFN